MKTFEIPMTIEAATTSDSFQLEPLDLQYQLKQLQLIASNTITPYFDTLVKSQNKFDIKLICIFYIFL